MSGNVSLTASAVLTLPNLISTLRILAGPACILLLTSGSMPAIWLALLLMVAAEISDYLDGVVARATGQISNVGKVLDPMADSLYRVAVFVALAANGWMPIWMLLIIMARDIGVAELRLVAERHLGTMGARSSGKWKAVAQSAAQITVVALVVLFGTPLTGWTGHCATAVLLVATGVTAYSFYDYAMDVVRRLSATKFA